MGGGGVGGALVFYEEQPKAAELSNEEGETAGRH